MLHANVPRVLCHSVYLFSLNTFRGSFHIRLLKSVFSFPFCLSEDLFSFSFFAHFNFRVKVVLLK